MVPVSSQDALLTERQKNDLLVRPERWLGRTITVQIYPYDNGYKESFVACFEACDAAGADESIVLIYSKNGRFTGYTGDKAVTVRATFTKACPEWAPLCLDAPFRAFVLHEDGNSI